jgi:hypothetical protein
MSTTGIASKRAGAWEVQIKLSRDDRDLLEIGQAIEVVVSGDDPERTVFNVILQPLR